MKSTKLAINGNKTTIKQEERNKIYGIKIYPSVKSQTISSYIPRAQRVDEMLAEMPVGRIATEVSL